MIRFFFQLIEFLKNLKISDFRNLKISDFQIEILNLRKFSKIRDFQIFRKFNQPEKINLSNFCFVFQKSQKIIEIPFKNTQQRLLSPPERGERALSISDFSRIFDFSKNQKLHQNIPNIDFTNDNKLTHYS